MTVKIFGSDTTGDEPARILGGLVCIIYVFSHLLILWIFYALQTKSGLKMMYGRAFYSIIGGIVGVMLMALDTQIAVFVRPEPIWPSVLSFLGFSFISVFLVLNLLRFIHALKRQTHLANQPKWTKPALITVGLIYMSSGFALFFVCSLLASPGIAIEGAGMGLFLLGPFSLFLMSIVVGWGAHMKLFPYVLAVQAIILTLAAYATFYFFKDFYARYIEFGTEILILVLFWIHAWLLLKQVKVDTKLEIASSKVPLIHEYALVMEQGPFYLNV